MEVSFPDEMVSIFALFYVKKHYNKELCRYVKMATTKNADGAYEEKAISQVFSSHAQTVVHECTVP